MGLYDRTLLPRILDVGMGLGLIAEERKKCLAGVRGRVLEVGFGSGHNLPFYPRDVTRLVALDPSGESAKLARKRIAAAPFPIEFLSLPGEAIPAPDHSFDTVVTTFTLCTIPDPIAALEHMLRVLKPEGRFHFLEHGRSSRPEVERWQNRLNGAQRFFFGGCNLNRDIARLIETAGFEIESLEHEAPRRPAFIATLYRGVARRPAPSGKRGSPA